MTRYVQRPNDLHRDFNLDRERIDATQWTGDNLTQIREDFPETDARLVTDGVAVTVAGGELALQVGWWLVRLASGNVHAMFPASFSDRYELLEDQS